ncbi:MAG: hypothetical protein ACT4PP_10815 [Sporichthyaceae bacterium]
MGKVNTRRTASAAVATLTAVSLASMTLSAQSDAARAASTAPVATIDWDIYTGKDGAPRYRVDGIGFGKGKVRVQVRNAKGKVLWSALVPSRKDVGVRQRTFDVGTPIPCNHRTRYARAKDPRNGNWTSELTLEPCVI